MRKILALLALIPLPLFAGTVDPSYTFTDFNLTAQAVRKVTQTPLQPFADYNGAILTANPVSQTTSGAGSVTFSNTVAGYAYRIEIATAYGSTVRTCGYPASVSGPVNGRDYLGDIKAQYFYYLYVSPGTLVSTNFPTNGFAYFALNTSTGYWASPSSLVATNVVWPVAGTNVVLITNGNAVTISATASGGGGIITNVIAGTNAEVHTDLSGNTVVSAITDSNVVNVLAAQKAKDATNVLGSAAYQPSISFQQNLGYTPVNKAGDMMGGSLKMSNSIPIYLTNGSQFGSIRVPVGGGIDLLTTNTTSAGSETPTASFKAEGIYFFRPITIGDGTGLTNMQEIGVNNLVADLSSKVGTNETRQTTISNINNVFGGSLYLDTTNGIYISQFGTPLINYAGVYLYGSGATLASASGVLFRNNATRLYDPGTGLGYYPDGSQWYDANTTYGNFSGNAQALSAIRGDRVNIVYGAGFTASTNGAGQVNLDSITGGGTVTSVGVNAFGGVTPSPATITGSGSFTFPFKGTILTNGTDFSTVISNNFRVSQLFSLTANSIINNGVGAVKLVGTDSGGQEIGVTINGGTYTSGGVLNINGGTGINTNQGSGFMNTLSNLVISGSSNGAISAVVNGLLTATTNRLEVQGTNASTVFDADGGLHVGKKGYVGGSNAVVEGVFTNQQGGTFNGHLTANGTLYGAGSNYLAGPLLAIGSSIVLSNGGGNVFGTSNRFVGINSNMFLRTDGNSNLVQTLDGSILTNLITTNLTGNVNLTNTFGILDGSKLNLTAGANITLTPSGSTVTIASSAAGGGIATINGIGTNTTFYGVTQIGTNFNSGGIGKFDGFGNYTLYSTNAGYHEIDDANSNRVFSIAGSNNLAYFSMAIQQTNGYGQTNYDGYYFFTNKNTHAYWQRGTNGHVLAVDQFAGTNVTGTNGYWFTGTSNGNYVLASNGTFTVSGSQTNLGTLYGANQTNSGLIVSSSGFVGDGSRLTGVTGGSGIGTLNGNGTNTTFFPSANDKIPISVIMSTGNLTNSIKVYGTNGSPSGFGPGAGLGIGQFATGPGNIDATNTITAGNGFVGNGSLITALNGSQITSGTVPDIRLSPNVPLLNASNDFTANNTFEGKVAVGTNQIHSTNQFQVAVPANRAAFYVDTNGNTYVTGVQTNSSTLEATGLGNTPLNASKVNSGNLPIANNSSVTTHSVLANDTGGTAAVQAVALDTMLSWIGSTTGNILQKSGSSSWTATAPSATSGAPLMSMGTGQVISYGLGFGITNGMSTYFSVSNTALFDTRITNTALTASTLMVSDANKAIGSLANPATAGFPLVSGASAAPTYGLGIAVTNGESQAITVSNAWRIDATHGLENSGAVVVSNGVYQPAVVSSITLPMGSWFTNNLTSPASGLAPTNSGGWSFSNTATNSIRFLGLMPGNWDAGTVQFELWGSSTGSNSVAGAGATNIVWKVRGAAIGAGDSFTNVTFGTAIFVTNHIGSPNVGYTPRPDTTAAITVGNSPTANKTILWEISREGGRPGDTATNGVYLADCRVWYKSFLTNSMPTASP